MKFQTLGLDGSTVRAHRFENALFDGGQRHGHSDGLNMTFVVMVVVVVVEEGAGTHRRQDEVHVVAHSVHRRRQGAQRLQQMHFVCVAACVCATCEATIAASAQRL